MALLSRLKNHMIGYCYTEAEAIVAAQLLPQAEHVLRAEAAATLAEQTARVRRETAGRIAQAIEQATPPSHGHVCIDHKCGYCCRVAQAAKDAKLARRIGGVR